MTLGTRPNQVASNMGPAAYPPTPNAATGLCLRSTRRASSIAGASIAKFRSNVAPPLPFKPATRNVSSGSPACGTSFISIPRCVPTSTTSLSLPLESHSCAIASAGKTCPPVPPPAISNFTWLVRSSCCRCLLRNIQQHTGSQQHDQQTRSPIADERQRDPFRRNHPEHNREINQRLAQDHRGYSHRQQPPESVRRTERGTHAAPAINDKERNHDHRPDKTQFLADHRVNKIRVRFRQIEELLFALHQANAREAPGADGNRAGEPYREPLPREPCNEQNGGSHNENIDRRPKVGLQQNQRDINKNGTSGWKNRPPEIFLAEFQAGLIAALLVEKPREIK